MVKTQTQISLALSDIETLLNDIPGHIYWKDKAGVILGCNLRQAQSSGFSAINEVVGKNNFELMEPEEAKIIRNNDVLVMQYGKPLVIEETAVFNGKKHIFLSHKVPIKNAESHSIGVLGVSLDITHQKELEEQLVKSNYMLKKALDRQKILEIELLEKNHQLEEMLKGHKEKVVA